MLNLQSFSLETFGRLEMEVYSSASNSVKGGSGPCRYGCGGKKFFDYHENATVNPHTGERRNPTNHVKKSNITSEKAYMNSNGTEQQIEKIIDPNRPTSSNVLEEVYKKSELYDATKIYENPFYHGINPLYNSSKKPEESEKPAKKKKVEKKNKIEEEQEEFDLTSNEIQFLWNLWLLSLMNPQINERANFLIDSLFMGDRL